MSCPAGAGSSSGPLGTAATALRAELTKLRTLPGTWWLIAAAAALIGGVGALVLASITAEHCPPSGCPRDLPALSLTGVWPGQAVVVVLAVLVVTDEYATGTIAAALAAVPRRGLLLAAKAGALLGVVLPAGLVGVGTALLAGRILPPRNGFDAAAGYPALSLADGDVLRAAGGTVLYLGLVALLALGIGTLLRHTSGALVAVLGLLYVAPIVAGPINDPVWAERLQRWSPNAGLAIRSTTGLADLPIQPWTGLAVLAGWAAAALLSGLVALVRRDG